MTQNLSQKWLSGIDRKVSQEWLKSDQNDPEVTQKWLFESLSSHFPVNPRNSLLSHFWVTLTFGGFGGL